MENPILTLCFGEKSQVYFCNFLHLSGLDVHLLQAVFLLENLIELQIQHCIAMYYFFCHFITYIPC